MFFIYDLKKTLLCTKKRIKFGTKGDREGKKDKGKVPIPHKIFNRLSCLPFLFYTLKA
jgi:hypothetical protein